MRRFLYALSSFALVFGSCTGEDNQSSEEAEEAEQAVEAEQAEQAVETEEAEQAVEAEEAEQAVEGEQAAGTAEVEAEVLPAGPPPSQAPPPNLAAGKPASQSSTGFGGLASRAVDGNTDGNWAASSVTHTALQFQPWWQVDLGAVYALGQIVLYNRTDCCSDRLANFVILASDDGASWTQIADHGGIAPARTELALNASGRYVRVQLQGSNYLSLAEVEVFPPTSSNLAAGRPARQSSTAFGGPASRAVDGNTDGNWAAGSVTHTALQFRPWWQVDLGAVYALGQIVLYNRTDCCGDRLRNFDIFVSNNGASWRRVATHRGIAPARTELALNTSGRYVKVQLRGSNYLSLAEVQVFPPVSLNLAAGKPARQSSTAFGGLASRAVDSNTDGNWAASSVTHTALQFRPWWQVDLGAVHALGQVVLYNRTDCCGDRLRNFDIFVSSNGLSWTRVATHSGIAPARTAFALNASGRYVKVQLRGSNYLSLAEVQVFARQNLAAGRPARQSSTGFGGLASRAVDGNTDGNWAASSVTHTALQFRPWWRVDLGAIYPLGQVILYNRTDCCGDRLADFDILVSNNGASWTIAATHDGIAPARTVFELATSGRFVKVQLRGTNYLSLAEVQVSPPQN